MRMILSVFLLCVVSTACKKSTRIVTPNTNDTTAIVKSHVDSLIGTYNGTLKYVREFTKMDYNNVFHTDVTTQFSTCNVVVEKMIEQNNITSPTKFKVVFGCSMNINQLSLEYTNTDKFKSEGSMYEITFYPEKDSVYFIATSGGGGMTASGQARETYEGFFKK